MLSLLNRIWWYAFVFCRIRSIKMIMSSQSMQGSARAFKLSHFIKRMLAGNTAQRASSHAQRSQRTLHPLPHAHRLLLGLRSICRSSCRTELRPAAAQTPTRSPGEQGSGWQAMRTGNSRPPHLLLRFSPYRWLWMLALR